MWPLNYPLSNHRVLGFRMVVGGCMCYLTFIFHSQIGKGFKHSSQVIWGIACVFLLEELCLWGSHNYRKAKLTGKWCTCSWNCLLPSLPFVCYWIKKKNLFSSQLHTSFLWSYLCSWAMQKLCVYHVSWKSLRRLFCFSDLLTSWKLPSAFSPPTFHTINKSCMGTHLNISLLKLLNQLVNLERL